MLALPHIVFSQYKVTVQVTQKGKWGVSTVQHCGMIMSGQKLRVFQMLFLLINDRAL